MPKFRDLAPYETLKIEKCAGGIVVNPDHGILVVRNKIGRSVFPKGKIEPGESKLKAAKREINEESGIAKKELELIQYLGLLTRPGLTALGDDGPTVEKKIEMYHFTTDQVLLQPVNKNEIEFAFWADPNELTKILFWQQEADFYMQHRESLGIL